MNFLNKIFHLNDKQASLKNEIIGGIITFIAMIYILPVNAAIMSDMGMNSQGVFAITAIVSCLVTLIMGIVANFPVVLSAGMGLNAFLVYTLSESMGFQSWQQKMILLTISGIIFFVFSLTPLRKIIIEAIPKDIRYITSLETERIEIKFDNYLFVLDKNKYSDITDYNLEIEANDINVANEVIKKYCTEFNVQYSKEYKSKSRRAINYALGI